MPPAQSPRVWVVDDSAVDAERARQTLAATYTVDVFEDGAAVLERLASGEQPEAMILDWLMPDVSGIEVVEFIRREPRFSHIAVLMLTVQQATEQIIEGLSAGADDYIAKPYVKEELRARVEAVIRTRQSVERAEHAERMIRRLLDWHPDGLIAVDRGGKVIYANDPAFRLMAVSKDEGYGRTLAELMPQLADQLRDRRRGRLADLEIDGHIFAPHLSEATLEGERSVLVALRDVTEERKAFARRVDFYTMVAHDLRSPLQAIHLRCQLARQGVLQTPEQIDECFVKISDHTTTLVALIDDFLDLGQLESTRDHRREVVDLVPLVRENVDLLEPMALQKKIHLEVRAPERAEILGDRPRLSQVISNIVGNALKFTPIEGHVDIDVRNLDGSTIEVSVSDDGPGIGEDDRPHVFERYRRGKTTGLHKGTGLGLTIVREVVEAHGGSVGVESEFGRGSRFWVRLPRNT